jgi:long-chain acyl-CoA synthetase
VFFIIKMDRLTIGQLLLESAERFGGHTAFQVRRDDSFHKYSYQNVALLAARLRQKLSSLGVSPGDRVVILSESRPEWGIAFLAVTAMGAVAVPLDALLNKEELAPLVSDAEPKAAVVSLKFKEYLSGPKIIIMEDFDQLPNPQPKIHNEVKPDDLASIVYTSGTTGIPKGVMLTHRNIMSNVTAVASLFDFSPSDNFLSVLPLHHTFETTAGFLAPFSLGSRITYAASLKSYQLLKDMQETGVTVMCGVPLLYQLFYDGIRREVADKGMERIFSLLLAIARFFLLGIGINVGRKLFKMVHQKFGGRIRFFVSGGAALDPELCRNFELLGFPLIQGYGLSESAPILTCNMLKANRIGSVGKVLPGVEIRISGIDPVGEIVAFGPNIMKGYYKRKELSNHVLVGGWLHTGDVGYLDEDGYLFITGRSKEVIVTGSGVNVYPEEVEFVLNKVPGIKESCVMGDKVKSGVRRGMEEVMALIVPEEGVTRETIAKKVQELNKKLPDFKRIARFVIRNEELPKTRLKKVKRFELKKELGV